MKIAESTNIKDSDHGSELPFYLLDDRQLSSHSLPNTVRYDGIYSWVEAFSLLLVESVEAELALLFGHPVGEGGHAHVHHPALLVVHARLKLGKQG